MADSASGSSIVGAWPTPGTSTSREPGNSATIFSPADRAAMRDAFLSRDVNMRDLRDQTGAIRRQPAPVGELHVRIEKPEGMEAAVAAGSTMVRVGRAVFGGRPAKVTSPA